MVSAFEEGHIEVSVWGVVAHTEVLVEMVGARMHSVVLLMDTNQMGQMVQKTPWTRSVEVAHKLVSVQRQKNLAEADMNL